MTVALRSGRTALNVQRQNCYLVLTRDAKAQAEGREVWMPLSRAGFKIVCPSKYEAQQLMLIVAQGLHDRGVPFPAHLDEEEYERWLLREHFRIVHYVAGGRDEVMFWQWRRGWRPSWRDMRSGITEGAFNHIIRPLITGKEGKEIEHETQVPVVGGLHPY